MRRLRVTVAAIAAVLAATIGGIVIGSAAGRTNHATVNAATATVQGSTEMILVNARGLPLYVYRPDTAAVSNVTGQLAALWPPLVSAAPTIRGATGRITSVTTTNGEQVTYNGHFLYTFVEDGPGRVTGQGVQNFLVATPALS